MQKWITRLSYYGGIVTIIGALVFLISGYGYQWGWWGLGFAFNYLLFYGGLLAFLGFLGALIGTALSGVPDFTGGTAVVLIGLLLGGSTIVTMSYWMQRAQKYPPIHDITTDTENPPAFKAVVPLRADAPNKTEYGGEEVAAKQQEFYTDIGTLYLDENYPQAYDRALEAARQTSWEIVDENKEEGRIEATHTLAWYGFKDDVVVRVDTAEADSTRSKIDVRSVSRIGRSDLGVNARRIKEYLERIKNQE